MQKGEIRLENRLKPGKRGYLSQRCSSHPWRRSRSQRDRTHRWRRCCLQLARHPSLSTRLTSNSTRCPMMSSSMLAGLWQKMGSHRRRRVIIKSNKKLRASISSSGLTSLVIKASMCPMQLSHTRPTSINNLRRMISSTTTF